MQFNEKIKSLRTEKGISQAELAKQIFVSRSAVAKWENGLGLPSEDSLNMLAEFFGVSTAYLQSDAVQEEVIIQKNTKLSKQKTLIIILSALLLIIAVISATLIPLKVKSVPFPDVENDFKPGRGLVFSTERYPIYDLSSYDSVNKKNGKVIYGDMNDDELEFYFTKGLYATLDRNDKKIVIRTIDVSIPEYAGCVNIIYGENRMSVKIIKVPTPVESVRITLNKERNEIGVCQEECLNVNLQPANATYQSYSLAIDKIERPDGSYYLGDISKFASIKTLNGQKLLRTEKEIEIGSKIHIIATAEKDDVQSDILEVEVVRIPITSLHLISENANTNHIKSGNSINFQIIIYPHYATANVLKEDLRVNLLTEDTATLAYDEGTWTLTASDNFYDIGKAIKVSIDAEEGYSQTFEWIISAIPVQSMTIVNAATDAELEEITYLHRGESLQLKTVIYPENASIDNISYNLGSDTANYGAYISVTDEGLLTIADNAPFDMEVVLNVTFGRYHSVPYKIVVEQRQVDIESVVISCETNLVEKGQIYHVTLSYTPTNADIVSTQFKLVNDVTGVFVSGYLIYISQDAITGSNFQIICYVNGIPSNVLEFTVVDDTVETTN